MYKLIRNNIYIIYNRIYLSMFENTCSKIVALAVSISGICRLLHDIFSAPDGPPVKIQECLG
jgi:hypothetical protein